MEPPDFTSTAILLAERDIELAQALRNVRIDQSTLVSLLAACQSILATLYDIQQALNRDEVSAALKIDGDENHLVVYYVFGCCHSALTALEGLLEKSIAMRAEARAED
jgi:hypothetical protein